MILMSSEIRINVRTTAEIKRDIEITARLKGLTVSSLINFLAVQAIREEKQRDPQAFTQKAIDKIEKIKEDVKDGRIDLEDKSLFKKPKGLGNAKIIGTPKYPELEEVNPKKRKAK